MSGGYSTARAKTRGRCGRVAPGGGSSLEDEEEIARAAAGEGAVGMGGFGCYVPGRSVMEFPEGVGMLLKKGTRISFGMHYFGVGEEQTDITSLALKFYPKDQEPKHQITTSFFQRVPWFTLDIPPNSVTTTHAYFPLQKNTRIVSYSPHMHMRGAAQTLEAILPSTGEVVPLSVVDRYDSNWQIDYHMPMTRSRCCRDHPSRNFHT